MAESRAHLIDGIADSKMRGGNAMALQELFGEALALFELGRGLRGTESRPAAAGEFIHHAEGERQLRANHGEIRLQAGGERDDRIKIFQVRGQALGVRGDAAIARRAIKLLDARRLPQLPYQRVLAPAAT